MEGAIYSGPDYKMDKSCPRSGCGVRKEGKRVEESKGAVTLKVTADTSELDYVTAKCERLAEVLREANALLRELDALTSEGICLELKVKS